MLHTALLAPLVAIATGGQFWGFGLIFGLLYFGGLLVIVLPWLQMVR